MRKRTLVDFIAHPIAGDVEGNIKKVIDICRDIHINQRGVIPFAPYLMFFNYLDDNISSQRKLGMEGDKELMSRAADRIRVYGPEISSGMKGEVLYMRSLERPILLFNPELEEHLSEMLEGYQFRVVTQVG